MRLKDLRSSYLNQLLSKSSMQEEVVASIPAWTMEEMQTARPVLNPLMPAKQLSRNFRASGGLPKALFGAETTLQSLEENINAAQALLKKMVSPVLNLSADSSHKCLQKSFLTFVFLKEKAVLPDSQAKIDRQQAQLRLLS